MLKTERAGGGASIIDLAEHRARRSLARRGAPTPAPSGSPTVAAPASGLAVGDRILCHGSGEVGEVIGFGTGAAGLMALIQFPSRRRAVPAAAIGASDHRAASVAATAQAAAQLALPCDCEPQP